MGKSFNIRSNFWLITVIGSLLVILVIALGISFFQAIYFAQVDSRREFLISQTSLAARGLEVDLSRFKEESKNLLVFLEDLDRADDDFQDDFTVSARRTFTSFPGMIDTIWVEMKDSTFIFTMTDRNDFIRKRSSLGFPKTGKNAQLLVEGKLGYRILYSLNIPKYGQNYVTNFYLIPGGEKYLFYEDNLISIGPKRTEDPVLMDEVNFAQIKTDITLGLKGFYKVSWRKNGKGFSGILAQYPFSYADTDSPASLVFFVPMEGLASDFYSTYLALFLGAVILLIGTVSFFIISLKGNEDSIKIQESNLNEISRLFDQQNLLLQELKGFVFFS